MLAGILLAAALAALWWFVRGDVTEYRAFKLLGDTASRRAKYRLWLVKAVLAFAVPTLVSLALLGRMNALVRLPVEFAQLHQAIGPIHLNDGFLVGMAGGGLIGGMAVGTIWALRRKRAGRHGPMLGDVSSLLPRNRGELPYAAALSIGAGVTEELFFRLLLPLLVALVTGSTLGGFVFATLLFGLVHYYQGWVGVLATTAMGCLFAGLYLATGSLAAAVALHVFVDLNGLVFRPLLTGMMPRD